MITRRQFVQKSAVAAGAATAGIVAASNLLSPGNLRGQATDPTLAPAQPDVDYRPVVTPNNPKLPWKIVGGAKVFHLVAEEVEHEFAAGLKAKCWGYNGSVHGPAIEAVEGDRVRIYDRLFLGGSNDLRGFNFRDVSPRDINGEPLGGQSSARFTIEYTVPLIEKARAAVFYDTGFVNAGPWDFSTNHVVSDAGVGLRLDLPIGPLRIDYGIPIQKDGFKDNGNGKFNFNVGYQF